MLDHVQIDFKPFQLKISLETPVFGRF